MNTDIPSSADVREALSPLNLKQIAQLAVLSGVPPTTIYKIRRGETENPGIETVRKVMPHIEAVLHDQTATALEPAAAEGQRVSHG